jgi:hypothetical protein
MVTIDQTESAAQDSDHTPASTALVPVTPIVRQHARELVMPRPDPTFVAHLIATAQQLPQTRGLRRAAPSDALSAYTAHQPPALRLGRLTRHVI